MSGVFFESQLPTLDTVVHNSRVFLLKRSGRVIRLFSGSQPYMCISVFIFLFVSFIIFIVHFCSCVVLWTSYV